MSEEKGFLDRAEALNDDALEQVAGGERYAFCVNCRGKCYCGMMYQNTHFGCNVKCTGCGGNVYRLVSGESTSHYDGICRDCGTRMGFVARKDMKDCWRV